MPSARACVACLIKCSAAAVTPSLNQSNNLALWQAVSAVGIFLNKHKYSCCRGFKPANTFLQEACNAVLAQQ